MGYQSQVRDGLHASTDPFWGNSVCSSVRLLHSWSASKQLIATDCHWHKIIRKSGIPEKVRVLRPVTLFHNLDSTVADWATYSDIPQTCGGVNLHSINTRVFSNDTQRRAVSLRQLNFLLRSSGTALRLCIASRVQYVNPLGYMAECATMWLTVLIAVNRYIAVCHPFKANRFLTIRTARIQVQLHESFFHSFCFSHCHLRFGHWRYSTRRWRGGAIGRASDLRFTGRGFDFEFKSWPGTTA